MKLSNVKVYDLEESIIGSGYPMMTSTDEFNYDVENLKYWLNFDLDKINKIVKDNNLTVKENTVYLIVDEQEVMISGEDLIKVFSKELHYNEPREYIRDSKGEKEVSLERALRHYRRVKNLSSSGLASGHNQYETGIRVAFDLTFTNKAWVELERYRFVEFVSSQSTMHRIARFDLKEQYNEYVDERIIAIMEELKDKYNESQDKEDYLRLLYSNPAGFELTARLTTNYRALKTVYTQRKNHRLPEWREFCKEIEKLPLFKEIVLGE